MEQRICSACRKPKEANNRYYCGACERAYRRHYRRRPNRRCSTCKTEPVTGGSTRCKGCERAYRDRRFNRWSRKCTSCGERVPHGYRHTWCPECVSLYYVERKLKGLR